MSLLDFDTFVAWCSAHFWHIVFSVFVILLVIESAFPRRIAHLHSAGALDDYHQRAAHVAKNLTLWALGAFVIVPLTVYSWFDIRIVLAKPDWALSSWITDSFWLFVLGFVLIDLFEYVFHLLSHHWKPLWCLHCVHHSDRSLDCSTGLLVHPLAPVISAPISGLLAFALGIPVWVVVLRALLFLVHTFWVHSNTLFPEVLDRMLRAFLVTPAMHRVHHSPEITSTNSNYGMFLSIWDHIFKTYVSPKRSTLERETFGLNALSSPSHFTLRGMLSLPLRAWRATERL
jgi:sterol desaturase/sphingolipid hydroxylase (fatty acid hydroxylase superfamily)